jgi:hypothetical protein
MPPLRIGWGMVESIVVCNIAKIERMRQERSLVQCMTC